MARILIADCWHAATQAGMTALGARSNVPLFADAVRLHAPEAACVAVNVADRESLPPGLAVGDFDGVILTGSPLHACDRTPDVLHQIDFARAVFATGVPVWGSCWGLQLAAVALGGSVRRNPKGREIGVARGIAVTEAGCSHPLLAGRPAVFDALCTHLDEVEAVPPGAEVLAGNGVSAVQAMAIRTPGGGVFFGTQYHPEIDPIVVSAILRLQAPALADEGFGRAGVEAAAEDWRALGNDPGRRDLAWRYGIGAEILDPLRRTAEIGNWLRAAVLPRRMR